MTVSVIIPTLGQRPEMLKQAVASIEAQTVPAEILIVDSPDTTYGNQARRLNKGVQESTGDAYVFMGDDDILMPEFVERMTAEMENWDIVTSAFKTFGNQHETYMPEKFPLCSTLVRRSMYEKTAGYDEAIPIGIDADFYFQCFEQQATWKIIPDILYLSRVHDDQYSLTGDWSQYKPLLSKKYNGKYDGF